MGLFSTKSHAVVLIDIGSGSVGGGFLLEKKGEAPTLCYTARTPVEPREGEDIASAMLRALETIAELLTREGAAALYREAGNAHIEMVLMSVAAPWQETMVREVVLREEYSFVFTRALMQKTVLATTPPPNKIISDTSVISTKLNGYETDKPWGKRVTSAEMTVLTSTLDTTISRALTRAVRKAFHSHTLETVAFAPVAYAVISNLYPLQKDFVCIDVSGTATDAVIVKQGVIAGVRSVPHGIHDLIKAGRGAARTNILSTGAIDPVRNATFAPKVAEAEALWLSDMKAVLQQFASEHPLPRSVFLLADEDYRDFLKRLIDESTLRTLWLSEEPLSVIPLAPEHTASLVRARGMAEGDIFLSMLALFYSDRLKKQ